LPTTVSTISHQIDIFTDLLDFKQPATTPLYGNSQISSFENSSGVIEPLYVLPLQGSLNGTELSAVPLPSAFWMFGASLLGLGTFAAHRRRAAALSS
jgi:hypothetical protein